MALEPETDSYLLELNHTFPQGVHLRLLPGQLTDILKKAKKFSEELQQASEKSNVPFIISEGGSKTLDIPVNNMASLLQTASDSDKSIVAEEITQALSQGTIGETLTFYRKAFFDRNEPNESVGEMQRIAQHTIENYIAAHILTQRLGLRVGKVPLPDGHQLTNAANTLRVMDNMFLNRPAMLKQSQVYFVSRRR